MKRKFEPALFKTETNVPTHDISKLPEYVVSRNDEKIHLCLKQTLKSFCDIRNFKDPSERVFTQHSAWEYTLWALDKDVWTMVLDSIPDSTQEAIDLLTILIAQYENIEANGITWVMQDKTVTESHYDFAIIPALQTCADALDETRTVSEKQWVKDVGNAQNLVPMYIVHMYCDNQFSFINQKFNLPAQAISHIHSDRLGQIEWYDAMESELAVSYAFSKQEINGKILAADIFEEDVTDSHLLNELNAMKKLRDTRLYDFNALGIKLNSLLAERQDMLKVAQEIQKDYPEQDNVQTVMPGRF